MTYSTEVVQSNIQEIWVQHKLGDFKDGSRWYRDANGFSLSLAKEYQHDPVITAGVISSLSPMKRWEENKKIATTFFERGWRKTSHWTRQVLKARLICGSTTPKDVDVILGGLKTINFFHNIYNPEDYDYITIDRHMSVIGIGYRKQKFTPNQYNFLKEEYRKFSEKVGINPLHLQATLWCTFKRLKGEI